jgi:hypothetical protein
MTDPTDHSDKFAYEDDEEVEIVPEGGVNPLDASDEPDEAAKSN